MATDIRCETVNARIRENRAEELEALIRQLFNRRHHDLIASKDKMWLTVELVQSLRKKSSVYRTMSSKTEGPLLFELGYFRIRDGALDTLTDTLPEARPEALARVLSEFLEPGAELHFHTETEAFGWTIEGIDELAELNPTSI